jgi:AcrR family transcriptional regulator
MTTSHVTAASASRLERKRARNREALIRAARRLFVKNGFDATAIADIAEAADLGFGTFYRYFADKEAVLEAVLDEGKQAIDEVIAAANLDERAAAIALRDFSTKWVTTLQRNRDLSALFWQITMGGRSGRRPLRLERESESEPFPVTLTNAIERLVARGIAAGEFLACDTRMVAGLLAAVHMHLLFSRAGEHLDKESAIETLCTFELRALSGNSPSTGAGRTGR